MSKASPQPEIARRPPRPPRPSRWKRIRSAPSRLKKRFANDLLGWEVMRAGRRTGTLAIARTAIGGLLLAAMWALWASTLSEQSSVTGSGTEIGKELNRFAENFAVTFFVVQVVAVLLLTPIFVAAAIFEERETRSGEILLSTELTRREVYVGKIGARMIQVLLVILAGMPILFLTQLWGGVSYEMILVNYAATCIAVIGAGVVTAAVSAFAESLRSAVLRSYGMLVLLDVLFVPASPFFIILFSALHWGAGLGMMALYLPFQGAIVLTGYFIGQRWLRMAMLRQKTRLQRPPGVPPPLPGQEFSGLPDIGDADPLLWKELHTGQRVWPGEALRAWLRLPGRAGIEDRLEELGPVRWLALSGEWGAFLLRLGIGIVGVIFLVLILADVIAADWVARILGGMVLAWLLTAVGLSAAVSISRERQKHTLVDLLMLPGPRRELLRAKAIAALSRGIWPMIVLGLVLIVSLPGGGLSILALGPLLFLALALTAFSVGLGIWLSARSRTALNATATWIGLSSAWLIGTFLLAEANADLTREATGAPVVDYPAWGRAVNPLLSWGRLAFRAQGDSYVAGAGEGIPLLGVKDVLPALVCPVAFGALGLALWWFARRRFESEGRT